MPSPSLAPSAVSSRGSLSARPLLGRSHAWLVRKPDLVWQILTDFLGGRADGQPFAFQLQKSAAERHFCAADDDEDERTSLSGFLPPLLRSKFGSRRSTLVRVNEVGRNADKFPLLPLIRGRTNRRSLGERERQREERPPERERGREPSSRLGFTGKSGGGVLRFLPLSRVPLFGSFYASAPRPRPRRHRLEWRRREQKEARSTAVKWGLATGDRREREGALWNWSDLGRERIQSPSLPRSPPSPRGLYLPHIAISPLLRMWGRSRGLRPAKNART